MTRPTGHLAIRPFRVKSSAAKAHSEHASTPFFGCPVCLRRSSSKGVEVRWMSPRHA